MIRVRVKYSGLLGEIVGKSIDELYVEEGITVSKLIEILLSMNNMLLEWYSKLPLILISINNIEIANPDKSHLRDGDIVELSLPLFEGGSSIFP